MKGRSLCAAILFVAVVLFGGTAWASDIDVLRSEMQNLRRDYEAKIGELQDRINTMESTQNEQIAEIEEIMEEQFLTMEYVGRYDGPFEKGGLIIRDHSGFAAVSVGGYMGHEFEDFENTNSTFDQHRWIINIGAELGERLRFYSELEIEHGGPQSANGDGEVKVEQAWIDYLIYDWLNVRAGALLVPFGRYNLYHDSDLQDLTDRPLVARDIIPTTWTESGAGLWGEFNPVIGEYEDLNIGYEVYVINGLDDGFNDGGLRGARGSIKADNNDDKSVVGRLVVSPAMGHEIGFSGYYGDYDTNDNDLAGAAIDLLTTWGPLEIIGEVARFEADNSAGLNEAENFWGYYVQANYHFWPSFLDESILGKTFEDPTFTLIGRYGYIEIDDDHDANTGNNKEERFTVGLNYRPVESWVFKLEYQWNHNDGETLERGDNNGFIASVAMGF